MVAGILALGGLGVFVGSAGAQGMLVYEFGDAEAWWNAHDCNAKRNLLGSGGEGGNELVQAPERSACKMFDGLMRTEQRSIEDFIDPVAHVATGGTANNDVGPFENTRLWWNDIAECLVNQKLGGELPLSTTVESDRCDVVLPQLRRSERPARDREGGRRQDRHGAVRT